MTSAAWQANASVFACDHCGAGLAFDGMRTATCPYCANPHVVERPAVADQPHPRFVVAFTRDAALAKRHLDAWLRSRTIFADGALAAARVEDLRGVYLPAYLYSAVAHTEYTATIGEHYSERRTRRVRDKKTREWKDETHTVTRTEYCPLGGRHVGYVTDVVVSASAGLANRELSRIEPFDLRALRRFQPALISGWITEEFSRRADDCMRQSREDALDELAVRLKRFMPGDSHSELAWRTRVEWETLDPILVPVWVLAVRYRPDKPVLRVVINGQTGAVHGPTPLAWWKVALGAIAALALIAALIYVFRGRA
jgi:hypothetical protein